jgi:hypothetical protein
VKVIGRGSSSSSTANMGSCHYLLTLLFGFLLVLQANGKILNVDKLQSSCYTGMY